LEETIADALAVFALPAVVFTTSSGFYCQQWFLLPNVLWMPAF